MNNDFKFEISDTAYINLSNLLNDHKDEYSCIRFNNSKSCCNNVKIDIMLDEIKEEDVQTKFKDLTLVYNKSLEKFVKQIEIIYKNSSFMMKVTPVHPKKQCNKKNTTDSCSSCSGCSKL